MDENFDLVDYFVGYGDVHADDIQATITSKREFFELASGATEEPPQKGDYYKHQIYVERLMEMVERVIVAHETGTGKSFLIGALIMAALKKHRRGRGVRHIYVLVSGPTQRADMTNMLVCRSTKGYFLNEKITDAINDRAARQAATTSLRKLVSVMTYYAFASVISTMTDEQIEQNYSDCEFIFDELHNFRINPNIDPWNYVPANSDKERDKITTYINVLRLTTFAKRIKVAGLSATLTVNDVNEAGPIFNLVLPPERRFPVSFDFLSRLNNDKGIAEIEEHLRSHVSYVRAFNTGAIAVPQGEPDYFDDDDKDPIKISNYYMDERQTLSYMDAWDNDVKEGKSVNGFRPNSRQAANGIFPDGSWGKEGFNKYIHRDEKRGWWVMDRELSMAFGDLDQLAELSIKARAIVDIVNESAGVVSIYMHQSTGSGIVYYALALEAHGYLHFDRMNSVFINTGSRVSYCSNNSTGRRIHPTFNKSPRLALITDGTPSAQVPVILDVMYSTENRYGEYIKVFMFTDRAKEGISINHGRVHIQAAGVWRDTDQYQAKSRIFRTTSHEILLQERANELMEEEGLDFEEAKRTAVIEVLDYKMAAVPNPDFMTEEEADAIHSVDVLMYRHCDEKAREAKKLYRIIKQVATDCHIHKERNVRETDVDGTAVCDYMECDYDCFTPKLVDKKGNDIHDYSTYDIFYMDQTVERIKDNVLKYFQVNGSGTAEMIKDAILAGFEEQTEEIEHDYREKYIIMVLSDAIIKQTPIIDRFGYTSYINEYKGMYYATHEYSHVNKRITDRALAYYGRNPIINRVEPYLSVFAEMEASRMAPEIEKLRSIDESINNYRGVIFDMLDKYNIENQALVIENAILTMVEGEESLYIQTILDIYAKVIFELKEPRQMIEETAKKAAGSISSSIVPVGKFTSSKSAPTIYLHSLYTHVVDRTKYSETPDIYKANGRLRMLKVDGVNKPEWRDPNAYEAAVYTLFIQNSLEEDRSIMEEENPIYGIMFNDGNFKIRDSTKGDKSATRHDGLIADSWTPYDLIRIMWEMEVPVPDRIYNQMVSVRDHSLLRNYDRSKMVAFLKTKITSKLVNIDKWEDDQVVFYFLWFKFLENSKRKNEIIKIIYQFMKENGKIIYLGKR